MMETMKQIIHNVKNGVLDLVNYSNDVVVIVLSIRLPLTCVVKTCSTIAFMSRLGIYKLSSILGHGVLKWNLWITLHTLKKWRSTSREAICECKKHLASVWQPSSTESAILVLRVGNAFLLSCSSSTCAFTSCNNYYESFVISMLSAKCSWILTTKCAFVADLIIVL